MFQDCSGVVKIGFVASQPPGVFKKRIELQQGIAFFDAVSNSSIYFDLYTETTRIRVIVCRLGCFETIL